MLVIIRGGGDLASGVALRLFRCGFKVIITELPQPRVVRRLAAFAQAVYLGSTSVEGITAIKADGVSNNAVKDILQREAIPVLVDPEFRIINKLSPEVVVDGRMLKTAPTSCYASDTLVIGLGPGFSAGENCDAVIETQRGFSLGRVIWEGPGLPDTGVPEHVSGIGTQRVLRAPVGGKISARVQIGDILEPGETVAQVANTNILAPFKGVLRGLIHPGLIVSEREKIGDIDPRIDPSFCSLVSDKALAVGGGVVEAILSRPELRERYG